MDAYDEDASAPRRRRGPGASGGPDRPPADPGEASPAAAADDAPPQPGAAAADDAADAFAPGGAPASGEAPASGGRPAPGDASASGSPAPVTGGAVSGGGPVRGGFGAPVAEGRPSSGVAALSLPYQVGAAVALAVVAVVACVHLGMVFLHVAPSNTLTKQHGKAVDEWIYPEFEQNWKLFAPNPLQQNIAVQVRAEVRTADGASRTTRWYDLSAEDGRAIDGNPLPSHTQQNELRRAFDFYGSSHDAANRPMGLRGALAEQYLRRIVVLRLARDHAAGSGDVLARVQVRSRISSVPPPRWSGEKVSDKPAYRLLPWWTVPAGEAAGGVR
ncbi:hypothetical protein GCM10010510_43890 [Streptomyces anandii JCM 4720]|nr:DUF5819 family protein [Streptomyces anandii]GGX93753.1 hypothetical protein GCM10010510_43890 [Streptomyces anandii JCM 4720]